MRRRGPETKVFRGVARFEGCDPLLLAEMAPHADRLRVRSGTVLATEGHLAHELVVLLDGTARATVGGRIVELAAGDAIAPDAAAATAPHPATVRAAGEVEVLVVNGPAFAWAAAQHPALARPSVPAAPAVSIPRARRERTAARVPAGRLPTATARTVHDRNAHVVTGAGR